jgi:hypothetical protein
MDSIGGMLLSSTAPTAMGLEVEIKFIPVLWLLRKAG